MSPSDADIAVVGAGPGGYATAIRAVHHGLRVVLIDAAEVGGTCLHRGCVPSKALLHVARLADDSREAASFGLATAGPGLDVAAAGRFRDDVVRQLHRGLEGLLGAKNVEVVRGRAHIAEPGVIGVGGAEVVRARHIVVATGSSVAELPGVAVDHDRIITSDDALALSSVPRRAVVVGAGAVGVEFASMWCSFGAEVVVVEALPRILPLEDEQSSQALTRAFKRRGIDVRTATGVAGIDRTTDGVSVRLGDGSQVEANQVLVAVGRRPATDDTGLSELGLLDERGYVKVDALGRTAVPGIWGVGDVVATLALAHAAFAEGFVVADAIAGLDPEPVNHHLVPRVTYCRPEVASVGLTEEQARASHDDIGVTVLPLSGNARAVIETEGGQVKLVTKADGTVLGVHIVGPQATELIGEAALATGWEALASELGAVPHAHPTLSEAVGEAALVAAGTPFHAH